MKPWRESLTEHFSHPSYNGQILPPEQMLDEALATAEHGLQHGAQCVKFDSVDGIDGLQVTLATPLFFPLVDLAGFGYVPSARQSAEDFVQEHWNWY